MAEKENEAPKKIYIFENHILDFTKLSVKQSDTDIEYIRADAFLIKASEFFGEHLWEYIDVKNANCDTFINIDADKLKKDFLKYMKGE